MTQDKSTPRPLGHRYDKASRTLLPRAAGFYWGKWRIKAEGTADEHESPGDEWEVMHVVVNTLDEDDDEHLMVMVPGVEKWQALDGFVWGPKVERAAVNSLDAHRECVEALSDYALSLQRLLKERFPHEVVPAEIDAKWQRVKAALARLKAQGGE